MNRKAEYAHADWFTTFAEEQWLKGDDTGEEAANFIQEALHLRSGDEVLDMPCGAGRIAVRLARAGCRLTGVDRMASFLDRARACFADEALGGEFVQADMREYTAAGKHDAAYNFGGSFGYFADVENLAVLRRFAGALKPGGRLLVDQPNREAVLRAFQPEKRVGPVTVLSRWNHAAERVDSTWVVQADGGTRRCYSTMRLYTPAQKRSLLARAGLEFEAAYGGVDGGPLTRKSRRLIVVARRGQAGP